MPQPMPQTSSDSSHAPSIKTPTARNPGRNCDIANATVREVPAASQKKRAAEVVLDDLVARNLHADVGWAPRYLPVRPDNHRRNPAARRRHWHGPPQRGRARNHA